MSVKSLSAVCLLIVMISILSACTDFLFENPVSSGQPNLVVSLARTSIQPPFSCYTPGAPAGVWVIIKNNGDVDADAFEVTVNDLRQAVAGLGAGEQTELWFDSSGYTWSEFEVTVDAEAQIVEEFESDNTLRNMVATLTPPPPCTPTPAES